jgi:hypothetical protein
MLLQWGEWQYRYPGGFPSVWVTGLPPGDGPPGSQIPTGTLEPEGVSATRHAVYSLEMPERRVVEAEYCYVHETRRLRVVRAVQEPDISETERERLYREYLNRSRWQLKALLRV